MRRDKALSDCCNLTLGFRGREKFSIPMLPSVGVACRLSTGDSTFETGDGRAECSCCRPSTGNLRVLGMSKMTGLDERPGNSDRGALGAGVDSALVLGDDGKCGMVGVGLGHGLEVVVLEL